MSKITSIVPAIFLKGLEKNKTIKVKRVGLDEVVMEDGSAIEVSTIQLQSEDLLFETRIIGGDFNGSTWGYDSHTKARLGHFTVVQSLIDFNEGRASISANSI